MKHLEDIWTESSMFSIHVHLLAIICTPTSAREVYSELKYFFWDNVEILYIPSSETEYRFMHTCIYKQQNHVYSAK